MDLANELRRGIEKIRQVNKQILGENPFWKHWTWLSMYESGVEWEG